MRKSRKVLELLSTGLALLFLTFVITNANCQIYEVTRIQDHKVIQYDTLDIRSVKEFILSGKSKELKSIKKYDSDGFLTKQTDYSKEGRKRDKASVVRTYTFNSERTQRIEVWIDPTELNEDTTFVCIENYAIDGKILSKIETRKHSGEIRTFDYTYDDHGNCESIRLSGSYHDYVEYFDNEYDLIGRIVRQVHTHKTGTKYEHFRTYNGSGKVKRNSLDNGQLIEDFTYTREGEVERREYKYDSTQINKEAIYVRTCVLGSYQYSYDKKGRLSSTKIDCESFVNNQNPYFMLTGEKFEYDEHGLLFRRLTLVSDFQTYYTGGLMGFEFHYSFY